MKCVNFWHYYSLNRSFIEVFDLVFSSTCLIITAQYNDGAEALFLSGNEPGTTVKNLYARLGTKGPNFCYAGHLDVVPAGNLNDWTVNPFKPLVKNGHLIGRGANDMKSSIAAFVAAISNFIQNNKKWQI